MQLKFLHLQAILVNIFITDNIYYLPTIIFTVSNDLSYDQRMQRICRSLSNNGYSVILVGRKRRTSINLTKEVYTQKRVNCFFEKGILFYLVLNVRLTILLLKHPFDAVCAIDIDTILPCLITSIIKKKKRIYDAHEFFSQQKEIVTRPIVYKIWKLIEQFSIPKFKYGYTVNDFIKTEFKNIHKVNYAVIRNLPEKTILATEDKKLDTFIIYQGAVNEGRCFETLIPAMLQVNHPLYIVGEGNYYYQLKSLINQYNLTNKIFLQGYLQPDKLQKFTPTATIGLTLFEHKGLNQIYSLSNKFFDYIMAGIPQICVNYPEYHKINGMYHVALLIEDTSANTIASAINKLLNDDVIYNELRKNCFLARNILCWQNEEIKLLSFYDKLFKPNV